ncbi:hypothetical protein RHMOL_Rhmol02G0154600 [Rhododendron molle]|uniref:Uncharacterized protein n=1 Tax=Rhododendron molle TaxID=49168 RepID=A0ACC0PQ47_RHOML|nr:hypothetical protein RHMOL_Rhmol02G0154600 [Rhododendron molle]
MDMVFFQETKQKSVSKDFINSIWWNDNCEFLEVDAVGTAGGLLCIWNSKVFCLEETVGSRNFIIMSSLSIVENEE